MKSRHTKTGYELSSVVFGFLSGVSLALLISYVSSHYSKPRPQLGEFVTIKSTKLGLQECWGRLVLREESILKVEIADCPTAKLPAGRDIYIPVTIEEVESR